MRRKARCDEGMVTAEAAVVLPALVLVLLLAVAVLVTVGAKLKVVDAAREAARVAARGEGDAAAIAAARQLSPDDPTVRISRRAGWVDVDVSASVRPIPLLPALEVSARALVQSEQP